MVRPLRIDVEGGWYHVTARGIERRTIFCDDRHHEHFLDLLGEMSARFMMEIHGYVLMGNHYHLILNSPHGNLSSAMQWLNVSYSAWFNAKHSRVGPVYQGRFGGKLIDGNGSWLQEASIYLHLNPVRVKSLGLSKKSNREEAYGLRQPSPEKVKERLQVLRSFKWSSYRAYAGYATKNKWLQTATILGRAGGKEKYKKLVESYVTRGSSPEEYETVKDRLLIGGIKFVDRIKKQVGPVSKEQPDRHSLATFVPIEQIVQIVERVKGENLAEFSLKHGDWGVPMILFLAQQRSGMTLQELGEWSNGASYKTVSQRIARFKQKMEKDRKLKRVLKECYAKMTKMDPLVPPWSCISMLLFFPHSP